MTDAATPTETTDPTWDVIVIGGGPAGSTTATALRQLGRRVLVLEKEKFPRFHIGESLLPYNRKILDELGVWPKVEAAGFMRKRGAQFWMGDATRHVRMNFAKGSFTEFPEIVQVERAKFDDILLRHAEEKGAVVKEEALVLEHRVEADAAVVKYRTADGAEHEAKGAFLVDASGLSNFTGNREGRREYYEGHKKLAIFGHYRNVTMPEGEEAGDILIIRRANSWFWMIPLEADKVSIGLVLDKADFQTLSLPPQEVFNEAVRTTPAVFGRMIQSRVVTQGHVVTDFSYRNNQFVGPRLMRTGDAAGFIDPIFSSGVLLAMKSGQQAARVIHEALGTGQVMTPAMRKYESDARAGIAEYWEFIEKFYTDHFAQLFFQPNNKFRIACAVNAVLAGCTELPFGVRWRLRMFFALVWLQKRFALAQRIKIG